jgi:hypothetical protein
VNQALVCGPEITQRKPRSALRELHLQKIYIVAYWSPEKRNSSSLRFREQQPTIPNQMWTSITLFREMLFQLSHQCFHSTPPLKRPRKNFEVGRKQRREITSLLRLNPGTNLSPIFRGRGLGGPSRAPLALRMSKFCNSRL